MIQYNQQPPVTVVTQAAPIVTQTTSRPEDEKFKSSPAMQMVVLSSIQLVMGILCVIFGIVLISIDNVFNGGSGIGYLAYGIWIGCFYALVGGISLAAAKVNTQGVIVAGMIFNIICSVCWCFTLLGFASAGLVLTSINKCVYNYLQDDIVPVYTTTNLYGSFNSYDEPISPYGCFSDSSVTKTFYALDSLMLLMSIAEFAITIWCAVLCCGVVCNCCKPTMVQYSMATTVPNQQIAMYPSTAVTTSYAAPQAYAVGIHQPPQAGGYMMQPQAVNYYSPPAYQQAPYVAKA